jgi:ABC-type uncharacterized transport system permease subunit
MAFRVKAMTITGLGISSGLVALAATLYAQKGLSGTPQDGQGMIVFGLIDSLLGRSDFSPHHSFKTHLLAITGGSFVYWYIIQILLQWIPNSSTYLYLYKALLLVLVLAIPYLIKTIRKKHARKKEEEADAPLPESL